MKLNLYNFSLMGMGTANIFEKTHTKSMQDFIQFFDSFSNKGEL